MHIEKLQEFDGDPAFSNVAVVSGSVRTIYIGGQDAVDAEGNIVGIGDIAAQTEQVLRNLRTALAAAGAGPEHVVRLHPHELLLGGHLRRQRRAGHERPGVELVDDIGFGRGQPRLLVQAR